MSLPSVLATGGGRADSDDAVGRDGRTEALTSGGLVALDRGLGPRGLGRRMIEEEESKRVAAACVSVYGVLRVEWDPNLSLYTWYWRLGPHVSILKRV
jgi:hypothetical protein